MPVPPSGSRIAPPGSGLTDCVHATVRDYPGGTAVEIAKAVGRSPAVVSGILYRLTKLGHISRLDGGGIRGGYIYFIKRR